MTDPPIVGDIGLVVAPPLPRAAARDQPGRVPRDRGRARSGSRTRCSSACCGGSSASTCAEPTASSRSARRCAAGSRRRASPPERITVIPNWVDTTRDHAAAARQRVGARARARRTASSSCTRATSGTRRISTPRPRDDVPPRPRRPRVRDRRLRRPPRRASSRSPSGSRRTGRALPAVSAARGAVRSRSRRADLHFVGLAEGLSGYVVPSRLYGILAAGRPVIVARRRRQRDGAARRARSAAASCSRPAGPSCSRERSASARDGDTISRRWAAAARVRRRGRSRTRVVALGALPTASLARARR